MMATFFRDLDWAGAMGKSRLYRILEKKLNWC